MAGFLMVRCSSPVWQFCLLLGFFALVALPSSLNKATPHFLGAAAEHVVEGTCTAYDPGACETINNGNASDDKEVGEDSDDGMVESVCQDQRTQCNYWMQVGECEANKAYMGKYCRRSCSLCPDQIEEDLMTGTDMGTPQNLEDKLFHVKEAEAVERIEASREYIKASTLHPEILDMCKNNNTNCTVWALAGECEKNPDYMKYQCGPACMSCEMFTVEGRCPLDPNAIDAWYPGDLNAMFEKLTSEPFLSQYDVKILSREPWVITMEDVISQEEADRLIELGAEEGYKRSSDVGEKLPNGTYASLYSDKRTSTNAWCQNECYKDPHTQAVVHRLSDLTGINETNSEYLQLLRYEEGQYYKSHHDYIPHNIKKQQGVRILTAYLYLNDVKKGGGTTFDRLGITVEPKRGRAVLWPSVFDSLPNEADFRTFHQALPVEKGIKYGANAWFHQRDFKGPNKRGCM